MNANTVNIPPKTRWPHLDCVMNSSSGLMALTRFWIERVDCCANQGCHGAGRRLAANDQRDASSVGAIRDVHDRVNVLKILLTESSFWKTS